ncbi:MAG: PHP domain-containing protein [Ardenticatenaceae bacterium]|nr:PHP domain-containing protein [Ardenticatenaceae bacterium]
MFEVVGNMHMHTPYSDGEKYHKEIATDAIRAGLDFIIVTDHNVWVHGVEGYYETDEGRVLLLTGEEVHHTRRNPQASHFLAYGAEKELACYAPNPQGLIDATRAAGGYGFLAHPFELALPLIPEGSDLGWHDWDIDGFTGLEIWNYMSSFKSEVARVLSKMRIRQMTYRKLRLLRRVLHPERLIIGPEPETLALWDELLSQGKRIAAIGNSDAHGTPFGFGPIRREIYPYEFLFRAVNTHLILRDALNGDVAHDKALILAAIGQGNAFVGYDMAYPTRGFRFSGQSQGKGIMGDEIKLDAGATLQVLAPAKANIRMIRYGEVVAEAKGELNLTHIPIEPGAYRVECLIMYEGMERGWIYSNPIYLV